MKAQQINWGIIPATSTRNEYTNLKTMTREKRELLAFYRDYKAINQGNANVLRTTRKTITNPIEAIAVILAGSFIFGSLGIAVAASLGVF